MKKWFLLILLFLLLKGVDLSAQVCIDHESNPSFVPDFSRVHSDGRQSHWIDLELIHDGSTAIDFAIGCANGSVVYSSLGTLQPNVTNSVLIQVLLPAGEIEVLLNYTILTPGLTNTCPVNYVSPLPIVPVCLEILNGQEINCIVDNDGIGIDGDIHVYQMTVYNNDVGPFEFSLTGTQDLSVSYHAPEYINPNETKTVTYEIRSNSGVPASGDLSFIFENQNFTSGCEDPIPLTFQPCEQTVCLEFGAINHDGCSIDNNGITTHNYNAQVINQSNIAIQYSVLSTIGGSSLIGATSRTIAPNTTDLIGFDYVPPANNTTTNSFYIEVETVGINNGCEEIITVALPNCANNSFGSMNLVSFFDRNNNGTFDQNEDGLPNINFTVIEQASGTSYHATTNAIGQALIPNLTPGLYLVNQEVNIPWIVNPSGGSLNNVLVEANNITLLEFANYHPNAGIAPLKLHNVEAVCLAQRSNGTNTYKVSGQLSTSFLDESTFQGFPLGVGSISNLAIGSVPPLASYLPFSFDLSTAAADSIDIDFRLSTALTQARDTMRIQLQPCCNPGGNGITDTLSICETVSVNYGAYILPNQSLRTIEVNVSNFQSCTQAIKFEPNNSNIFVNGVYVIDGDTIINGTNTFNIPQGSKKLTFYLDGFGTGQIKISAIGCQDTCVQSFTVGQNFTSNATVGISQVAPSFSNIYGASFKLDDLGSTMRPKYLCLGFDYTQFNTKVLGVTAGNYFYFGGRNDLLPLEKVDNTNSQIRFTLPDYTPFDQKQFNVFYTSTRKDVKINYVIYSQDGAVIGSGNLMLDGEKVVSKIDDVENAEDDLILYPNPAGDFITVTLKNFIGSEAMNYNIYDMSGKAVGFGTLSETEQKLNISALPAGSYSIHVTNTSGYNQVQRFSKI